MRNDFVIIVWIKVSSRVINGYSCWYKVLIKVSIKQASVTSAAPNMVASCKTPAVSHPTQQSELLLKVKEISTVVK